MDIGYENYEGLEDDVYENKRQRRAAPPAPPRKQPKRRGGSNKPVADVQTRALKRFQKGEYPQCAELLTPYVEDNRRNILCLKLLAFSLIYTGHLDQTKRYFQKVLDVDKNDVEALNALAYFELSQANTEAAINHLLDAIYVRKDDPRLKDNLEKIRNMKDPKVFVSMTKPEDFLILNLPKPDMKEIIADKFYNVLHSRFWRAALFVLLVLITVGLLWAFWPSITNALQNYSSSRMGIAAPNHRSIDEINRLVRERTPYNIHMTDLELEEKFQRVRINLQEGKRNLAQILINEILNSDAPELVKERTIILQEFVPDPDIENLDYVPPFPDVQKTPYRYDKVYVKWNGTIAGIQHNGRDETVFNLMINLNDPNIVEGTAQVYFDGFVRALNGEKVTVFGEIAGITLDNQVILRGKTIIRLN